MECPPSTEGRFCDPSKSYSSFTISAELGPVVSVSPDKSGHQRNKIPVKEVTAITNVLMCSAGGTFSNTSFLLAQQKA